LLVLGATILLLGVESKAKIYQEMSIGYSHRN